MPAQIPSFPAMFAAPRAAALRNLATTLAGIVVAVSAYPCPAGERNALLIANSHYEGNAALRNPGNDVDAMEAALTDLGFSVTKQKDLDLRRMDESLVAFRRKLGKGGLAMFFYSGHGMQVKGGNYLVPLGADPHEESQVKYQCFDVGQVLDLMTESGCNLKVVVLDCCRDNPFQRSWSRNNSRKGLAGFSDVPQGTIIAFSTSPNATAADGDGSNSPYTEQLVSVLRSRPAEGLELSNVFRKASQAVKQQTGQVPWLSLEASLEYYYLWKGTLPGSVPTPSIGSSTTPSASAREVSVSLTVHRGEEDGPPVEGADVELVYLADEKAAPITIGRGRTDAEGKTRIEAALTTAQQHAGTFEAVINADGVHKDWPLPEFPTVLAWNVWLPNRPPRPKTPDKPPEQTITNSIGMKLTLIPAGEFTMGSSPEEIKSWNDWFQQADLKSVNITDEGPEHRVRITRPFYMGTYHVTWGQFRKFVATSGYQTEAEKDGKGGSGYDGEKFEQKPEFNWRNTGFEQGDEHPVVNVSWNDAVAFCEWLSAKEGKTYRLPTEAEWEYACRAGTTTRYYNGDDEEKLVEVGNVADATLKAKFPNAKNTINASDGYAFTSPVGKFKPNAFGLYDMHGNAYQWCADWYNRDYYAASPNDDPKGPDTGSSRVSRGGGWFSFAAGCRSARRIWVSPVLRSIYLGFRVARSAE
jgi:formylglycine-generating enzyme required for sulfatase activity